MFHRRKLVAPINTIKHITQRSRVNQASGTNQNLVVVESVVAPASGTTFEVLEGAIVKAVFIELWIVDAGASGSTAQFTISVEKVPGNSTLMTFTNSANLSAYPNKKNIFYVTQGITTNLNDTNSVPIIRQWISIPKGKQRMGLGDKIVLNIASVTAVLSHCGLSIFKEYR